MENEDLSKSVAFEKQSTGLRAGRNQCVAHKKTGERCRKAAMRGQRVCRFHGGATKASRNAAQMRLLAAAEPLVVELIRIALDKKNDDDRKLRAIMDALNRMPGLNARQVIDTVAWGLDPGPSDEFERHVINIIRTPPPGVLPAGDDEPEPDVIEAEVVDDPDAAEVVPIADGLVVKAER
jgi:hypothetical protein